MMTSKRYTGKPAVKRRVVAWRQAMYRSNEVGYELRLSCGHVVLRKHLPESDALCQECGEIEKAESDE